VETVAREPNVAKAGQGIEAPISKKSRILNTIMDIN